MFFQALASTIKSTFSSVETLVCYSFIWYRRFTKTYPKCIDCFLFCQKKFTSIEFSSFVLKSVRIGGQFESLVGSDKRFELPAERHLGLVVFRLKGENELTEQLLKALNSTGLIHCVPASIKGKYIIRFTVTATSTNFDDIRRDWKIIETTASQILQPLVDLTPQERRNRMKNLHDDFRMSLLLSNTPHSPCLINGSYAAILPLNDRHIYAMTQELSQRALKNSLLPISTRRRTRRSFGQQNLNKQVSVDEGLTTNDQQKHLIPEPSTSPYSLSRQGSLDSRVEEILENNNNNSIERSSSALNEQINMLIPILKIPKE